MGIPQTRQLTLLLLALLLTAGCVTAVTELEFEEQLEATADRIPNLGRKRVIPIYAETPMLAKALLYEARHDQDSQLSALLGKRIAAASKRGISIVVGGPYPDLTEQVLSNALNLQDAGLRGVKVVLVGAEGPSTGLTQLARDSQVRLYHHSPR